MQREHHPVSSEDVDLEVGPEWASSRDAASLDAFQLLAAWDRTRAGEGALMRAKLRFIAAAADAKLWEESGCRDMAQYVAGREHISNYKARRWIGAAFALEHLARTSDALESGALSIDKVVELARFATPATERKLITWARRVSPGAIKAAADAACCKPLEEVADDDRARSCRWGFYDDGTNFFLQADLPCEQGAVVAKALEREAATMVRTPEDDPVTWRDAARADALVALASARIAADGDPDRATVVAHVDVGALLGLEGSCCTDGGAALHPEVARRLSCDARLQSVIHGADGHVIGIGRTSMVVPRWLRRQLLHRDHGCTFPGCGTRRLVDAHHIVAWDAGGPTNLDNLIMLCRFHHRLVHEHRWKVFLGDIPGTARWLRPDGRPFEPGRAPPVEACAA